MPATNYTPIQLYRSTTSGNTPLAANMSAGEIALNIADNDMSMWMENASGTVKRFFNNPAALKYPTADGTSGQVIVTDGSGNLSFATPAGGALTNNVRQAVTSSATTTLNLNSGNVIDLTMAANITTLSFTNVPASGTPILIQIVVRNASNGTAYTIVWPNSVYWSGQYAATTISTVQTAPTLATGANGVTVIALLTTDGGTKWRGWVEATIPGGTGSIGSLYTWGNGADGRLGQNSTTSLSSPVQVGALVNWVSVAAGNKHCIAIKSDGTLWSWGYNNVGQLGQNSTTYLSSPVQVGALTTWASCTAGNRNCTAINSSGQLFSWGANLFGGNGNNLDTGNVSSPVQIGAGQTWAKTARGSFHAFAITTTGQLWAWGNNNGRLGLNNTSGVSSPTQVGALTNWSNIAPGYGGCLALKTDGTIWTWGTNYSGQLGQNNRVYASSPVQVGALSTWADIGSMMYSFVAISTAGTLWSWGQNDFSNGGQLGQNDSVSRSSPVQVGALTTWSRVNKGFSKSMAAITTSNALFVWGRNTNGALGLGDTISKSSPVQLGSLTSWTFTSIGYNNSTAAILGTAISPA